MHVRVHNLKVCTDKKHNSNYFNINNIYGTYSLLTHVGYAKLAIEFSRTSESCSHGPDPACCLKILCTFFFFRLTWLPYFKKPKHACEPPKIYSKNTPWEHLLLYQIVSPLWQLVKEISLWPQDQERWGGFVHVFVSNFQLFLDIKSYYAFKHEFVSCLMMWRPLKWNKC